MICLGKSDFIFCIEIGNVGNLKGHETIPVSDQKSGTVFLFVIRQLL